MGFTARNNWTGGWSPNSDAIGAPFDRYLRGDNLQLDELNVLGLRRGSAKINATPFADLNVHSMFTTPLNGVRYRMAGVDAAVYANGSVIQSGMAGTGDTAFGFHLGQILFARGSTKKKYDGSTVRNWGIAMTGAKPTAVEDTPDGKTFVSGASSESPAVTAREGVAPTFGNGGANECLRANMMQLIVDNTSKKGVWDKVFSTPQDFTTYDGGTIGGEDDVISWYMSKPNLLKEIQAFAIQVDVNDGQFTQDYYMSPVLDGRVAQGTTIDPSAGQGAGGAMGAAARRAFKQTFQVGLSFGVSVIGFPVGITDLRCPTPITFKRSDFTRIGKLTNGKGWNTVKAVRILLYQAPNYPSIQISINIDTIRIASAKVFGETQWKYIYVRNASGYQAKSALSVASDAATFSSSSATVTVPSDTSRDSQVNEIWLYRKDKLLETYYRTAVKTGVSGTGSYQITDTLSAEDAIIVNIKAELDNVVPPDNIISIVGPHFDRTLVLTSDGKLWPSRRLDPDAFATGQTISVAGTDETTYWAFRSLTDIFVGTSKDIYRLEGTGAEQPDGSIDYVLRPMSMDHRPLNPGVTHEGDEIAFFSDDGWRAMAGTGSKLLTGETSLLYRNQVRHGVGPVNLGGRVRAALAKGQLVAITPEGSVDQGSCVLYRYVFARGIWYRQTYGQTQWLSLYREPDGTLIAGDTAGTVWVLDVGTQDNGANIAVVFWTKADNLDAPYQRKKIGGLLWRSETGGAVESIAVHRDAQTLPATILTVTQSTPEVTALDLGNAAALHAIGIVRQIQFRVTGSFAAFHLYDFGVQFRERPVPLVGRVPDVLGGSPGVKILSGYVLKGNTLGATRIITPYLDGVADTETFEWLTSTEEPETHELHFSLNARRATDIGFAVDGEIEIDSWSPIISSRQPVGVLFWDSGPVDLQNNGELTWLRAINVKVRAAADLTITPYFDGVAFPNIVVPIPTADLDRQIMVSVGRNYVGRQPRITVSSCEPFHPYWAKFYRRVTGTGSQKPHVTVPFTLQTGAGA